MWTIRQRPVSCLGHPGRARPLHGSLSSRVHGPWAPGYLSPSIAPGRRTGATVCTPADKFKVRFLPVVTLYSSLAKLPKALFEIASAVCRSGVDRGVAMVERGGREPGGVNLRLALVADPGERGLPR